MRGEVFKAWWIAAGVIAVILVIRVTNGIVYFTGGIGDDGARGRAIECGSIISPRYDTPGKCTSIIESKMPLTWIIVAAVVACVIIGFAKFESE